VLARLARWTWAELTEPQRLVLTRALGLAFVRLGAPTPAQREQWLALLHPHYTAGTSALDAELASLLVYLGSPRVVEQTVPKLGELPPRPLPDWAELIQRNASYGGPIASMLADMPPLQDIQYAFVLRNATEGWTPALRRRYFEFFNAAAKHPGGASYGGFLTNARSEALERLSPAERLSLASITGEPLVASRPADVKPPVGPGRKWTIAEAEQAVGAKLEGRSFARGRNLFHAASCSQCHRMNGEGGAIGPDLTSLAHRFSTRDVLEAILEPDKVISEQYGSQVVTATWGESFEGRVVHDELGVLVFKRDPSSRPERIAEDEIESIEDSKLSQMPAGLMDALNAEELRDLMAFLVAGGREEAEVFRKTR
jgi:putative heme-binding domain-containing protein